MLESLPKLTKLSSSKPPPKKSLTLNSPTTKKELFCSNLLMKEFLFIQMEITLLNLSHNSFFRTLNPWSMILLTHLNSFPSPSKSICSCSSLQASCSRTLLKLFAKLPENIEGVLSSHTLTLPIPPLQDSLSFSPSNHLMVPRSVSLTWTRRAENLSQTQTK